MKWLLLLSVFFFPFFSFAQKAITLSSPDKQLEFSFLASQSKLVYSISYKRQSLIENSPLSLVFSDQSFSKSIRSGKPVFKDTTEEYDLLIGKASHVKEHYKEVLIPLSEPSGKHINIRVRAFDDGIAFRYEFPSQDGWSLTLC